MRAVALAVVLLCPVSASAGVVLVPDHYPTIQAAIDAVNEGDEVHVRAGTWNETLNFRGKGVRVLGLDGAAQTTIDGQGAGTVVTFDGGEPPQAILEGFTITGGTGTLVSGERYGGGLRTDFSSPTLRDLVVTGNQADHGGGIAVHVSSGPRIEDCVIRDNEALTGHGGGVYQDDSGLFLVNCQIEDNELLGYPDTRGAGVYVAGKSLGWIEGNTIARNELVSGYGAGVCIEAPAAVVVIRCLIEDNGGGKVPVSWADGAGIAILGAAPDIIGNVIRRNWAQGDLVSTFGGGVFCSGGVPRLVNNLIHDNSAHGTWGGGEGGGVHVDAGTLAFIEGCTIVDNDADQGGGLAVENGALTTSVENSILYGNNAPVTPEVQDHSGLLGMRYCDVGGGWPGTGNFDLAPGFVDPGRDDFRLQAGSSCVDAGDPNAGINPSEAQDVDGNSRLLDGDLDGGRRHDVGAYEHTHVRLQVTGTFETGQQIQIDTTGTPGMATFLLAGVDPGQPLLLAHGFVFVRPGPGWLRPWPSAPSSVNTVIPAGLPVPFEVMLQDWAVNAASGNLSNPVRVRVEK